MPFPILYTEAEGVQHNIRKRMALYMTGCAGYRSITGKHGVIEQFSPQFEALLSHLVVLEGIGRLRKMGRLFERIPSAARTVRDWFASIHTHNGKQECGPYQPHACVKMNQDGHY